MSAAKQTNSQEVIDAWHTNDRVTTFLIENLPAKLWPMNVPGFPRRTVRAIAAHIHNARCIWVTMIGKPHGIKMPRRVNSRTIEQSEMPEALARSSKGMVDLINLGAAHGGKVPPCAWQNFPTDLPHFLSYFVAHEAHHRGQLIMIARQLGHRLPDEVVYGVWQWKKRARENK